MRPLLATLLAMLATCSTRVSNAAEQGPWDLLRQRGAIVLFRHANAPGSGDPAGFKLGDCATQRNLDETGHAQARRIGAAFRAQKVMVARVWSSQWCRARDTARLAFPGRQRDAPAFNSFFADTESRERQTRDALLAFALWKSPGVLVVVTHQVNITALTGVIPAMGEGIIVRVEGDALDVVGRITP
jgi:phosphohistidine phosphatase SixA